MAISFLDLFTRAGRGLKIIETINASIGTTVPADCLAYQNQFNGLAMNLKNTAVAAAESANQAYRSGASGAKSTISTSLQNLVIEMANDDNPLNVKNIESALNELCRQMIAAASSVDASAVGATASAVTGNGNGVLVVSAKRSDGRVNETMFAETIRAECTADTTPKTAAFIAKGKAAVQDKLSELWPGGSGIAKSLTAIDANDSLIGNGDFDEFDDVANAPDEWIISVGTVGTTIKGTVVEVQRIVVSGSPTTGTYIVNWTNASGKAQSTAPLAHNASAATLQAALRLLVGLESVTVASSGTAPNYTHDITFTGVPGSPSRLRITNNTDIGAFTHSTTTQGSSVTEVQTVAISGTPAGGTYTLTFTNAGGSTQTTSALAFNATAAQVQAALRALNELEEVTVAESGVSPNVTHTVTFTGIGGNIAQLTSASSLTGGAPVITHATTTQGINLSFVGKALELDSDGSQLTTINRKVSLEPLSQYAFNCWMLADVVPAAGVITVDLVDGIGGVVINDAQGIANSFTVTASALTTSFAAKNGVFRTPKILPPVVYLRIRISTAVSNTSSIYIDHSALAKMTSLYAGGPEATIFSGSTNFTKATTQQLADYFTITATNDRAGEFQEWFERCFGMAALGLILPSNSAGAETIDDALIV